MNRQMKEGYVSPELDVIRTECEKGFCNSNLSHESFEREKYEFDWE